MELEAYLDGLASASAAPGGGSAATIVAAYGAALVAMVARITLANVKFSGVHGLATELVDKSDRLRARSLAERADDEAAYGDVMHAMALPKDTAERKAERTSRLQTALAGAAAAPLRAAETAKLVAVLAERALALGNKNLESDLGAAAEFAQAALNVAASNVRTNHALMKDRDLVARDERTLERYESETAPLVKRVRFEVSRSIAT